MGPTYTTTVDLSTSNGSITVANVSGASSQLTAVSFLSGPKGDKGDTGAAGATGATGPAGGVTSVNSLTGVVTLTQDTVGDGTTYKQYSATEKTKLAAISGTNTGDETLATIKTKLGITTLSGSNTGDQDLSSYATTSSVTTGLAAKQATLVSGTTIKTINSTSLLGSGDIVISGGGTTLPTDAAGWLHDNGSGTLAWTTPAKSDVGLGNVDNTSDSTKNTATATLTNKSLTSPTLTGTPGFSGSSGVLSIYSNPDGGEYNIGASATGTLALFGSSSNTLHLNLLDGALYIASTLVLSNARVMQNVDFTGTGNTWPIFNQNTTGSAATLTTPRTINGVSFNGSANIVVNKPRTGTTTSSATPTINTDNIDFYSLTAQAVDITSFTTNLSGTPAEGQKLWIAITGTAARAITWGTSFEASTVALPTTTVTTNRLDVGFIWNSVTSKWRCMASG